MSDPYLELSVGMTACISFLLLIVTNYRKLNVLKQEKCIFLHFWRPEVQTES